MPLDDFPDRKALARYAEARVRTDVAELLRAGAGSAWPLHGAAPQILRRRVRHEGAVMQLADLLVVNDVHQRSVHGVVGAFRIAENAFLQRQIDEVVLR